MHLAANLKDEQGALLGLVKPTYLVDDVPVKIGVVGIVGPSVAKEVRDPAFINKFLQTQKLLQPANKELADKGAEMLVLLYQGTLEEAKALAATVPHYAVILSLSKEEEPREDPVKVGNTLIINVGHKGRKVGVLGAFRNPKGTEPKFEFHYELCSIGPEYQTPDDKPGNKINDLMEDYAKEVKGQNFLAQHARTKHPIQLNAKYAESKYVGSEGARSATPMRTSVERIRRIPIRTRRSWTRMRPGLRQYDPECARCHVTGLDYASGFQNETASAHLKDNGCENCHGPASMHIKNKSTLSCTP